MKYLRLAICLILPQLAGFLGSLFTIKSIDNWYLYLNKPSFNPPNWIFGPVWTLLYLLMGFSIYLIWQKKRKNKKVFWIFWVHLFFNAIWTPIFFGLHNLGLAFACIVLIWLFIIYLIISFWKINKLSSIFLWPYLLWVSFAAILNYSIWQLN